MHGKVGPYDSMPLKTHENGQHFLLQEMCLVRAHPSTQTMLMAHISTFKLLSLMNI